MLFGLVGVLSVVVFKQEFQEGVASYGRIIAAGGAGVIAGMFTVGWFESRLTKSRIVAVAFAAGGVACLAVAPVVNALTILVLSFALGISYPWRKIPIDTIVQETIPDRFRGQGLLALRPGVLDRARPGRRRWPSCWSRGSRPGGCSPWSVWGTWSGPPSSRLGRPSQRVGVRFLAGGRADETPRAVVIGGEVEPVEVLGTRLEDRGHWAGAPVPPPDGRRRHRRRAGPRIGPVDDRARVRRRRSGANGVAT